MVVSSENLRRLEGEARERLRTVQLVCELGIDSSDEFFSECHSALNGFLSSENPAPVRQLSSKCPALFVLVLAVIGAELGSGGELWEPIVQEGNTGLFLVGLDGSNSSKFGEQFRHSLKALGLPDFSHLERRRNLGPILLHAGIPVQSAEEVWNKTLDFVQSGVLDGREIVQDLRSDNNQIRYFKKPAQSFVTEAGAFAVDLIQRMVNVVVSTLEDAEISAEILATRHGLPTRLVAIFTQAENSSLEEHQSLPSANIYLDIDSGFGPYCLLPPIRDQLREYSWSVQGRTIGSSRFDEKTIQLEPSQVWSLELMTNGRRIRSRKFSSLTTDGAWLFTETGQGLRMTQNAGDTEEGLYFLLASKNQKVRVQRNNELEEVPVANAAGLGNAWSGFVLYEVDLVGAAQLCIESVDGSQAVLEVAPLPLRPQLLGDECLNIQEVDGYRVFSGPPRIGFIGRGGDIVQFTLSIRKPDGEWQQSSLASLEIENGEISLENFFEWETGSYRIEITGPLGSGLSEKFVLLLGGSLDFSGQIYSPSEPVRGVLEYKKNASSELTSIGADFPPFKDRLYLKSSDDSVIIEARIPRLAFDFGGVGRPPDFSHSVSRVLAIEDLNEIQNQQLQIRTGRKIELELIIRDKDGGVFHRQPLIASTLGFCKIEVSSLLDSIRMTGASETTIEIVDNLNLAVEVLSIKQTLDFQILETSFQLLEDEVHGVVLATIKAPIHSPNTYLYVQSLERVWETPTYVSVPNDDTGSETRLVQCPDVVPGNYVLGLSVGSHRRAIPSSCRIKRLGTDEEIQLYQSSIRLESECLAERIVNGAKAGRLSSEEYEIEDVKRVTHFMLLNQRKLPFDSDVFKACIDFMGREGHAQIIAEWLIQVGTQVSSTRDIENLIVRLFPIFVDNPLSELSTSELRYGDEDEVLISRLWTLSSIVGLVFTHRMTSEIVEEQVTNLGSPIETLNFEELAELTWSALTNEIDNEPERQALFSRGFGLVNFFNIWAQCWPNGRLSESRLQEMNEWSERGSSIYRAISGGNQIRLPRRIAETAPAQLRDRRRAENLAIAKFIHNLFRLSWISSRVETPIEVALHASQMLGERYGFAKGLCDRALALALLTERPRRS